MGDMEPEPFAECEHPCVIREHDSVDLLQALLLSDAYDHIHELIPKAFTLKVVMDHNSKLPLPEIGFNDQPPDPDEPLLPPLSLSLPLSEFGDDCHLPIIINIGEADQDLLQLLHVCRSPPPVSLDHPVCLRLFHEPSGQCLIQGRQPGRKIPEDLCLSAPHAEDDHRTEVIILLGPQDQLIVYLPDILLDRDPCDPCLRHFCMDPFAQVLIFPL